MYNIWLLEFFWTIFVKGQMQLIQGSSSSFNLFFHNNGDNPPIFSGYFEYLTIFYINFFFFFLFCSIVAFVIRFISINANFSDLRIKEKLIEAGKNFGGTLVLLMFLPLILFVITILMDVLFSEIFTKLNLININNDEFMKQLYSIGIGQNLANTNVDIINFNPPSVEYIESYNFFVQFIVINTIMITYLYLMWTFFQKLIEIMILYVTAPFAGVFAFSDDNLKIKLWFKKNKNKYLTIIITVVLFCFYNYLIMILINAFSSLENSNLKFILSVIFSIALFVCIVISVNIFNKRNDQYKGIIKSLRSIQDSIKYNFLVLDNSVKRVSQNSKYLVETNQINHNLVEQVKNVNNTIEDKKTGLTRTNVF